MNPDLEQALPLDDMNANRIGSVLARDGFVRLRSVFSRSEVGLLSNAVAELLREPPTEKDLTWFSPRRGGGHLVQRISQANRFSSVIASHFLGARQLLRIGSCIFNQPEDTIGIADGSEGSDGIVLVVKDPKNLSEHKDLRWHRDESFTQDLPINPFVNCGLYLDRADSMRGALLVLPASHRTQRFDGVVETTMMVREQRTLEANPGDVILHRADVLHRSGPHRVDGGSRRVLYANLFAR